MWLGRGLGQSISTENRAAFVLSWIRQKMEFLSCDPSFPRAWVANSHGEWCVAILPQPPSLHLCFFPLARRFPLLEPWQIDDSHPRRFLRESRHSRSEGRIRIRNCPFGHWHVESPSCLFQNFLSHFLGIRTGQVQGIWVPLIQHRTPWKLKPLCHGFHKQNPFRWNRVLCSGQIPVRFGPGVLCMNPVF